MNSIDSPLLGLSQRLPPSNLQAEQALLGALLAKWSLRTRRTWIRHNINSFAQMAATLAMRIAVIGTVLLLWWQGQATPGDTSMASLKEVAHATVEINPEQDGGVGRARAS